jgi:acetyl-CoA C-acetyltransferase
VAHESIAVLGFARTPFRRTPTRGGGLPVHSLAARTVDELLRRTRVDATEVDGLLAGVTMAAPEATARAVARASELPSTANALTVNRGGCSGMTAIGLARLTVGTGHSNVLVCGGFDAATNGHVPVGIGAAALAQGADRATQDQWASQSHARYFAALNTGFFDAERFAIDGRLADELPRQALDRHALAALPTVDPDHVITSGNAAEACEGAAFLLIARAERAAKLGLTPIARLVDHIQIAGEPDTDLWLPALAIRQMMKRQGRAMYEIDLLEIDETYAAKPLVSTFWLGSRDPQKAAGLRERTNVHGGALAIGDAPGATGARMAISLINALARRGGGRGVAAISDGCGQAEALMVEV